MKGITLILIFIIFVSSCDFNEETSEIGVLEKSPNNFLTSGDLKNIGEFHNQILENIVFDEGINKKAKIFLDKNARTSFDSLEFMKDLQSYISKYTQEMNLTALDTTLDHSSFQFNDEELIILLRGLNGFETEKRNTNLTRCASLN